MNKTVKYMLGLGAAFLAGAGTVYVLTHDMGKLWNRTKYAFHKAERAAIAFDEALYEAQPEPLKEITDLNQKMVRGVHNAILPEALTKEERIQYLEDKIKQYEQEKK
ncbi:MAG: hypothetical protein QW666_01255 [Candidatus Woesearchaeota archaeon]